ncbi:hypothetical protein F2Q69_00010913 [Brassica cretica]|uniref:Uncharacterized protein n=1 Tax=Brassica cretica TaxID=69181 RepID=A0A8S9R9P7_BRACR|nr:hypothetical protein F2Q69_00010913 [Brassica cretica]
MSNNDLNCKITLAKSRFVNSLVLSKKQLSGVVVFSWRVWCCCMDDVSFWGLVVLPFEVTWTMYKALLSDGTTFAVKHLSTLASPPDLMNTIHILPLPLGSYVVTQLPLSNLKSPLVFTNFEKPGWFAILEREITKNSTWLLFLVSLDMSNNDLNAGVFGAAAWMLLRFWGLVVLSFEVYKEKRSRLTKGGVSSLATWTTYKVLLPDGTTLVVKHFSTLVAPPPDLMNTRHVLSLPLGSFVDTKLPLSNLKSPLVFTNFEKPRWSYEMETTCVL